MASIAEPSAAPLAQGSKARTASPHNPAIDIINFFLIWVAMGLAIVWPFQLFLFSYIVLGPLHYLTEINWLEKQNYFLRQKKDCRPFVWTMVVLVSLLTMGAIAPDFEAWKWTKPLHDAIFTAQGNPVLEAVRWSWSLTLIAFVAAAAWLFTDRWDLRIGIIIFCLLSSLFFYTMPMAAMFCGVLLPTIGHVFFFTILFMLFGTMKSRSSWGYVNVASMFLAVAVIAALPRTVIPGSLSNSVIEMTMASAFQWVNIAIHKLIGLSTGEINPYSPAFFKVQSFIAFAYTYHYLNWFSKTSIIKWHKVEKSKFVFSGVLWAASIALYKVDYRLGFAAISAISVLHIVLEFPLNFVSIRGIFGALKQKPRAV